jgi:aryl-alcohol dehydrogenase-like predicted oxidoreductase
MAALTTGIMLPSCTRLGMPMKTHDRWGTVLPSRILGRTNEPVTMLGLGGNHIGRMTERDAEAAVEFAIEGGIRFFDTAESYQQGGSEQYYGKFLTPKYRDDIFLMTKSRARTAADASAHLERSLARLKTDHLDLWQVHSVVSREDNDHRINEGVLDVALEAKQSGKARFIGLTGHFTPRAHRDMLERTDIFDACQMPINVADAHYESFIASRHFRQHGQIPRLIPTHVTVREAIHFVWSLPVSVLISGPDNLEQLHEKISLAHSFVELSESQREELVAKTSDLGGPVIEFYKTKG